MPRSSYEVVIFGRELTGVIAATLLSQRGLRVLCISGPTDPPLPAPGPGGATPPTDRYNLGPYVLPTLPMQLVGPDAPGIRRILAELNLVQLFRRRIEPNRPSFQVLLPNQRIDVDDDLPHALDRELPSALPAYERAAARVSEVSAAIESILSEDVMLPPDGFWDRRDGKRVAARLPDDTEDLLAAPLADLDPATQAVVRTLFTLPARFYGDLAQPGAIATARAADLWRRGSFRIDGGREGLRQMFQDRLHTQGGEYRPELRAQRVIVRRGRIAAIDVGAPEGEIGCEQAIAAMPADAILPLFEGEQAPKRLLEAAESKATLHRYLLHMVVPLDVLPDALGRLAFSVRDPDATLVGENALRLHLADGYGQHAVLSAEALTPDPTPGALKSLRVGVRAHLTALLPFVDRHLLCVHSPHDGIAPEGVGDLAPPPRPLEALWELPSPRLLGVCGLPYDSGVRGLYLASRQSLPGLGLEGELEAALRMAKTLAAGTKRRDAVAASLSR